MRGELKYALFRASHLLRDAGPYKSIRSPSFLVVAEIIARVVADRKFQRIDIEDAVHTCFKLQGTYSAGRKRR